MGCPAPHRSHAIRCLTGDGASAARSQQCMHGPCGCLLPYSYIPQCLVRSSQVPRVQPDILGPSQGAARCCWGRLLTLASARRGVLLLQARPRRQGRRSEHESHDGGGGHAAVPPLPGVWRADRQVLLPALRPPHLQPGLRQGCAPPPPPPLPATCRGTADLSVCFSTAC